MKISEAEESPRDRQEEAWDGAAKPSRFTSLTLEIIIMSAILVLTMSGTMGMTVAWIYGRHLAESQLDTAAAAARGAALALATGGEWRNFPWPALAGLAGDQRSLGLALVVDARGRPVHRGPGAFTPRDNTALRAALAGGREEYSFDGRHVSVSAPVVRDNVVIGAVCFTGVPKGLWTADASAKAWISGALGLNLVLMGLFSVFLLNRRLVAPLKELARDLADLGRDKFQLHPRSSSSREIDLLFQAFDRAAAELMANRRQLEEQLKTIRDTEAHLAASEKAVAVGRLASGIAHELGNPIGALTGFVHLLSQGDLTEEDKELVLRQSAHELERMDCSIKEMLRFSRPGKRTPEPVDAAEVAAAAISLARPQKWAAGLEFILESVLEQPMVMTERNSLLQVLLNLVANAGQALAGQTDAPRIRIVIGEPQEGRTGIMVIDNGAGVCPDDEPHLFEPYFSRKAPGQGTGLGLAISLSIINSFNGSLSYSPNSGGGAVFTIQLPSAQKPLTGPEGEARIDAAV